MEQSVEQKGLLVKARPVRKRHPRLTKARLGAFLWGIIRGVIVLGICFIILKPVFIKISLSIMAEKDLYDSSIRYVAKHFTLDNYRIAWKSMDYVRTALRTVGLAGGVALTQLFACLLTAYGFARFRFPGKRILFAFVIIMMIVPPQVIMLPLFLNFRFFDFMGIISAMNGKPLNLIDSFWPFFIQAITCTGFKNGLYIYMLRQFFKGMPKELEEAAFVDGSGKLRTFVQIMLPSAVPMMVTVFLFGFVWQWTDSFYSSLYLNNLKIIPNALTSLLYNVAAQYESFGGDMNFISPGFSSMINNTGVVLTIIPLIILYVISQKSFIEGIERSGIVG
ncbi:multiple sugar transport system permease protein [Anaerotaenia torta]|uniref:carbohydrate ABC transporter permease n=1 Tax=Anaerotaenia torta TaxID=433293 RepID=UPI003D1BF28C